MQIRLPFLYVEERKLFPDFFSVVSVIISFMAA